MAAALAVLVVGCTGSDEAGDGQPSELASAGDDRGQGPDEPEPVPDDVLPTTDLPEPAETVSQARDALGQGQDQDQDQNEDEDQAPTGDNDQDQSQDDDGQADTNDQAQTQPDTNDDQAQPDSTDQNQDQADSTDQNQDQADGDEPDQADDTGQDQSLDVYPSATGSTDELLSQVEPLDDTPAPEERIGLRDGRSRNEAGELRQLDESASLACGDVEVAVTAHDEGDLDGAKERMSRAAERARASKVPGMQPWARTLDDGAESGDPAVLVAFLSACTEGGYEL